MWNQPVLVFRPRLFNDAFDTESVQRHMMGWLNDLKGHGSGPVLIDLLSYYLIGGTEGNEDLNQDRWCSRWELNHAPAEYNTTGLPPFLLSFIDNQIVPSISQCADWCTD
jgi:hypothetical protein